MRKTLYATAVTFSLAFLMPAPAVLAEGVQDSPAVQSAPAAPLGMHRVGLGVNYWKAVSHLGDDVHHDGFSYLAGYQYAPVWFLKVEADLELFPDLAGSSKTALAPEVYLTLGGAIYAGVGIGMYYFDSEWSHEPFYMLRAGFDFPILPRLFLDINANYRFNDWNTLSGRDLNTDTIRLGAALRFVL